MCVICIHKAKLPWDLTWREKKKTVKLGHTQSYINWNLIAFQNPNTLPKPQKNLSSEICIMLMYIFSLSCWKHIEMLKTMSEYYSTGGAKWMNVSIKSIEHFSENKVAHFIISMHLSWNDCFCWCIIHASQWKKWHKKRSKAHIISLWHTWLWNIFYMQ